MIFSPDFAKFVDCDKIARKVITIVYVGLLVGVNTDHKFIQT